MREFYKMYYRTKGVRYPASMVRPSRFRLSILPKDSIFHYFITEEGGVPDINQDLPIFTGFTKKILYKHITSYIDPEGTFRRPAINIVTASAVWRRAHSKTWMLADKPWRVAESPDQLIVINYGYLDVCNLYMPVQLAKMWRWRNTMRTVFSTMNEIAKESSRQQFIVIKVPGDIQGKAILDRFMARPNNITMMNLFAGHEIDGLMQLEMWRWLSEADRDKSILNCIEEKNYGVINFVFEGKNGSQALVNLAYLNSWIRGKENTTELNTVLQFPEQTIQKLYLKLLMTLNQVSEETIEAEADSELTEAESKVEETPIAPVVTDDPIEEDGYADEEVVDTPVAAIKVTRQEPKFLSQQEIDKKEPAAFSDNYAAQLLEEVDEDIEVLDKLSMARIKFRGIELKEETLTAQEIPEIEVLPTVEEVRLKVYAALTPTESLVQKLTAEAESNSITASDFRKMSEAAKKYSESADPYGSGKNRSKAMLIEPSELLISQEDSQLETSNAVADKTMERSSLAKYDKLYIKTVMKKDVLQAVDALQATGVIIRSHEVETTVSALGAYEHHRLELKPVDGVASTINFTLPVVDKDGTYLAGGNKYILRKQRVD